MLKELRGELAAALGSIEAELETLGGSATTVTGISTATAKTNATKKSMKAPSTIAEE